MRSAIISDVHANLEALQAVLEKIYSLGVERILCLGDIVGYGANPNECIELVSKNAHVVVCGNHDHAAIGKTNVDYFNSHARAAVLWTTEVLKPECAEYLKGLPCTASIDGTFLVHSSPGDPESWNYILEANEAAYEFRRFGEDVCFIGHSHVPLIFMKQSRSCRVALPGPFRLEAGARYIVNVGSVGQPRDGLPGACFVTLDMPGGLTQYHRVDYNWNLAHDKIMKAGLPRFLAERLLAGE